MFQFTFNNLFDSILFVFILLKEFITKFQFGNKNGFYLFDGNEFLQLYLQKCSNPFFIYQK